LFAEIGERQRKGRRHAQALGDSQQGEDRKIGCRGQQAGRDRKHSETDENAKPPVDMRAEKANDEPGYRHAQRAGTVAG